METSSSSSFTYGWTYDVFISFRGVDTRLGFTGNLYIALCGKEIKTFMDDQDLEPGAEITTTLDKAILESRIAIVVFSKNYAASTYCLEELAKIIECSNVKGMLVWPIFYQVQPSDVRHQRGSYAEALVKHECRYKTEKIEKWRVALTKAAERSGSEFRSDGYQYEYQFIAKIIEAITKKISSLRDSEYQQPKPESSSVKYGGEKHLSDNNKPSRENRDLTTLEIPFPHATKNDVVIDTITLPKQNAVENVINDLKSKENQDLLIKCISQDLGFSGGKPVAACVIYKCLLHWRSFEVERTGVFDRIIQTIASVVEAQDNTDVLAYWLSNTSTLLLLLHRTLKLSGAASLTLQRRSTASASIFGRMSQELRASLWQVEAKFPALLFKQQLTVFLEKIYGMVRDNLKKEISPFLGLCIQAPRTSGKANAVAQQALIAHWQSILNSLNNYLKIMKVNYVPPFLVRKVFTQIFSFINVQLFNSLLLRRECCSFSHGEYVKAVLGEFELWCVEATEEYDGSAWEELKHIRQAVGFLVMHQKYKKTLNEITKELCPVLSIPQLYRISRMYWDDKFGTRGVSTEVITKMRAMMLEDSINGVSSSCLLDDDLSIPFSVDDLYKSMQQVQLEDVEPPSLIRDNPGFGFLLVRAE